MEVTWRGFHDAVGMVKENCYEMRCEPSKSEARKLDRAAFCGVNLSIGAGGSYCGRWSLASEFSMNFCLVERATAG